MRGWWWLALILTQAVAARTLTVGPEGDYARPSEAARMALSGDTVLIDARGDYRGDVAVWHADGLVLRGVNGRPVLYAAGRAAQGKAIWVIRGHDVVVENIAFVGTRVRDKNGAGIRLEGGSLTVRRCRFEDNENGILTNGRPGMYLTVEDSEFLENGAGDGYSHQIYAGRIDRLVVRGSRFRHARVGHHIKSRARRSLILYNRLEDGFEGRSSYAIDLPEGGEGWIVGNLIQQGMRAENRTIVAFGLERLRPPARLVLVHNTLVNDQRRGTFVKLAPGARARVVNNLFVGRGLPVRGEADEGRNLILHEAPFRNPAHGDYRLGDYAEAIDRAEPWPDDLLPLTLCCEPPGPEAVGAVPRRDYGPPDLGAWEWRPVLSSSAQRLP